MVALYPPPEEYEHVALLLTVSVIGPVFIDHQEV